MKRMRPLSLLRTTQPARSRLSRSRIAAYLAVISVARVASEVVTGTSCRTLEHLCGLIADRLEAEFSPDELEIRAAKTEPPPADPKTLDHQPVPPTTAAQPQPEVRKAG